MTGALKKIRVEIFILIAALLFYLATVFVRLGHDATQTHPLYFLAGRFWLGYLVVLIWRYSSKEKERAVNRKWLNMRAFWNVFAVFCFYLGVIYGTVTGSNILNMTHPAFVAIYSGILLKETLQPRGWGGVALAIGGAFLIIGGGGPLQFVYGDLWGLLSAITAGLALTALRKTRLTDTTNVIIWYVFRMGFQITLIPVLYLIFVKQTYLGAEAALYVLLSAICGVLGQMALTYGFKFVSAVRGSILSSARLIYALLFGWLFWESEMTIAKIGGAFAVLGANILLANRNKKE